MADCIYCGQPAGVLKKFHKECRTANVEARSNISVAIERSWFDPGLSSSIKEVIDTLARRGHVQQPQVDELVDQGVVTLVDTALADRVLTADEESQLGAILDGLGVDLDRLQEIGVAESLTKALFLRDLENEILKSRFRYEGDLPIVLGKKEQLLWVFQDVDLLEYKTTSRSVGRSHGVSIRIARGVYYRVGAFKGNRINETSLVHTDSGNCFLSESNWYFSGSVRKLRIPLKSVLSVEGYADGIEISVTATSTKPRIFRLSDPEFTGTALTKLASMAR